MLKSNPTKKTYDGLDAAFVYFNRRLFGGRLPPCLVTLQRKNKARGYFSGDRFGSRDGREIVDQIALNPKHFKERTLEQILSTLVHEMVHLWQHHFGKSSRSGYHNREWAAKMEELGLTPSSTGKSGGKRTGQHISHYVVADGPYARAFAAGKFDPAILYHDLRDEKQSASKLKVSYSCAACGLTLWGKAGANVACLDCDQLMVCKLQKDETTGNSVSLSSSLGLGSTTAEAEVS